MSNYSLKIAAKLHKKPDISLIICTHNRANQLEQSLGHYSQLEELECCEVLVVINACTDNTRAVAEAFQDQLPLRIIEEHRLGISNARNAGWKNAKAPFVFYMDDDAYPNPKLITQLKQNISPEIACISGQTRYWKCDDPAWILPQYVETPQFLDQLGALPQNAFINGCACGFHTSILDKFGGFNPNFGMIGKKLGYCDEIYIQEKIKAANMKIIYNPKLVVYHRSHQKTPMQFLKAAYAKGKSKKHWKAQPLTPTFLRWLYYAIVRTFTFPYYWFTKGRRNALVEQFSEVYRLTGLLY